MATRTWETREQPILEAVADREESGVRVYVSSDIGSSIGLDPNATSIGFRALEDAGYILVGPRNRLNGGFVNPRLSERGRRAVGQWQGEPYDELLAELRRRVDAETDPGRRGILERLVDAVQTVGEGVTGSVLAEVIKHTIGL